MEEGWKMFIEDIRKNKESLIPQLLDINSNSDILWFCKGRNDVYQSILGLQPLIEQARKQLEEEDEDEFLE
jgi:hypothetical protein